MPFSVLVVCVGNVCRSPQAERLLRLCFDELLRERRDEVSVASAGVRSLVGHPMDAVSASELARMGGDPDGFVSRQLVDEHVNCADLVLTATKELVVDAARRRGSVQLSTYDLSDPIGASPEVHRDVAEVIERCTRTIAGAVARSIWSTSIGADDLQRPR